MSRGQSAKDSPLPADGAKWLPCQVPGTFQSVRGEKRWLRRRFTVPKAWAGRRVYVVYDGVKYNSVHVVNGKRADEHFRGYDRFEIDATPGIKFGAANELWVWCSDWQGTFSEPVDLTDKPGGHAARGIARNVGLTPIGGRFYDYGIWADVKVVAVHSVHVSDVTIRTSVRKWLLDATVEIRNASKSDVRTTVRPRVAEANGLAFDPQDVSLRAGERKALHWQIPWRNPKLWSIEHPHLYHLDTTLSVGGQTIDTQRTRFGFREFWCDGPYFRLNGTRLLLPATSTWPLGDADKATAAARLKRMKDDLNVICFRTHTQPWRQYWYDAADEVGMLMIPEGPVWNDDTLYKLDDQRFWDNYAAELHSMVQRFKNNPSVVIHSLENEFYGSALNDKSPAKAQLVRMGELVRKWDPTRPFMYESDGDPNGVADIVGIHYPHEMGRNYLYPNSCYWMDEPKRRTHWFGNGEDEWKWGRKKPLYLGEYLWSPCPTPKRYTTFFGDVAYRNYHEYHHRAIGKAWSMQTRVYRYYRVSGLSPWTCGGGSLDVTKDPMAAGQAESMRPLAAFVKEYNTRLYAGAKMQRTLHVMNDTLHTGRVKVTWELGVSGASPQRGEMEMDMAPADLRVEHFEIAAPSVAEAVEAKLTVRATMPNAPDFEDVMDYEVHPRTKLSQLRTTVGGVGTAALKALKDAGLNASAVPDIRSIPRDIGLLIVGRDALPAHGPVAAGGLHVTAGGSSRSPLQQFVTQGGRVLLMAQTKPHAPVGSIQFTPRRATMVFPLVRLHPALDGVSEDDLKFWSPDHFVADAQVDRAGCGGKAILVSGGDVGIAFSPLAECRLGKGLVIACGLRLLGARNDEPVAMRLLGNILKHMDDWQPSLKRCVALGPESDFAKALARLDVGIEPVASSADVQPDDTQLVAVGGSVDEQVLVRLVETYVRPGGRLWWHRPAPDQFDRLMKQLGIESSLIPASGAVSLKWDDPFVDGLAQADLYWPGEKHEGAPGWARRPLDPAIIDSEVGIVRRVDVDQAQAYPCLGMQLNGSKWNRPIGEGFVILASTGSVIADIDFGKGGPTLVGFRGKGSPAEGVWPRVAVAIDGKVIGHVNVTSSRSATYGVAGNVSAGKHRVELRFINDRQSEGEDRNAYFSHLYVQPTEAGPQGIVSHASPAALVTIPVGKGSILVDTIKWDDPGPHAEKARNFVTALLLKLGAYPRTFALAAMEAEQMELEEVVHNSPGPKEMILANEGSVWADVQADEAGKYVLRIYARGQLALDEWPILAVKLDDKEIGKLSIDSPSHVPFSLPITLPKGEHRLDMRFINDAYDPGNYDRNCYIDRVEIWQGE